MSESAIGGPWDTNTYGGFCPVHHQPYPCRVCTSAPSLTAPAASSVTTRMVPTPCAVCDRKGFRPDPSDDSEDAEWIKCDACDGKGWSNVIETTTTRLT